MTKHLQDLWHSSQTQLYFVLIIFLPPTQTFLFMYLDLNSIWIHWNSGLRRTKSWLKRPVWLQVTCSNQTTTTETNSHVSTVNINNELEDHSRHLDSSPSRLFPRLYILLSTASLPLCCHRVMCNKHTLPVLLSKHIIDCIGALDFRWFALSALMLHLLK